MFFRVMVASLISVAVLCCGYYGVWYYSTQQVVQNLSKDLHSFWGGEVQFASIVNNQSMTKVDMTVRDLRLISKNTHGKKLEYRLGDVRLMADILEFNQLNLELPDERKLIVSDGDNSYEYALKTEGAKLDLIFDSLGKMDGFYLMWDRYRMEREGGDSLVSGVNGYLSCLYNGRVNCALSSDAVEGFIDNINVNWQVESASLDVLNIFVPALLRNDDAFAMLADLSKLARQEKLVIDVPSSYVSRGDFWASATGRVDFGRDSLDLEVLSSGQEGILNHMNKAGFMTGMQGRDWYSVLAKLNDKYESAEIQYVVREGALAIDGYDAGQVGELNRLFTEGF